VAKEGGVYNHYPTAELVNFVARMLLKYRREEVLSEQEISDEGMKSAQNSLEWKLD
jgi:hypothetical protein